MTVVSWRDVVRDPEGERAAAAYPVSGAAGRAVLEANRRAVVMRRAAGLPEPVDDDDSTGATPVDQAG